MKLRQVFWVVAGFLLSIFAPKGGPEVSPAYGAILMPQQQDLARAHVNASLPPGSLRDGMACGTGFLTITEGLNRVAPGGVVEVCDGSSYGENLTMTKNGVTLVSTSSGLLPPGFDAFDVAARCGETDTPFPTISGSAPGTPVITVTARKDITIKGFNITGGGNPVHGGGIRLDNCTDITIVANCIFNNEAGAGGGIGIQLGRGFLIDRNFIFENEATDRDGGGIWLDGTDRVETNGNIISFNTATDQTPLGEGSGGGIASINSRREEHINDTIEFNMAFDFGGGAHHEEVEQVTYDNCTFRSNESEEEGGGGINASRIKQSLIVRNCTFTSNRAGFFAPSLDGRDLYFIDQGGGGIRVLGGDVEISDSCFDSNETRLDGGGVMIGGEAGEPLQLDTDRIVFAASGLIEDCDFIDNFARDDGGGFSNQVKARSVGERLFFNINRAGQNGGAYHSTCSAVGTYSQWTVRNNTTDTGQGGGLYTRSAEVNITPSEPPTIIEQNSAASDGGGQFFGTAAIPAGGPFDILPQFVCNDLDPLTRVRGATFQNNQAGNFGGALAIRFADPEDDRSITFRFEQCTFTGNLGKDTTEGAVDIRFHDQPPRGRSRSRFTGCTFNNRGVQIKSTTEGGNNTVDFWDVEDCTFFVTLVAVGDREPVGLELFADSPRVRGKGTLFEGPIFSEAFGIVAKRATNLEVDSATFKFLKVGIISDSDGGAPVNLRLRRRVTIDTMADSCIDLTGATLDTRQTTFRLAPFGIRLFGGSTIERAARLTTENTFIGVTVIVGP